MLELLDNSKVLLVDLRVIAVSNEKKKEREKLKRRISAINRERQKGREKGREKYREIKIILY